MSLITVAAYQFIQLEGLPELRRELKAFCLNLDLKGTILLAPEGINCFIAGTRPNIDQFKQHLEVNLHLDNLCYKENICTDPPFKRMLVKLKKEIITMGEPSIVPEKMRAPYMEPAELKSLLDLGKEIVLLDTRNDYEVEGGTFEKAMDLKIGSFREFPRAVQELPENFKDKTVVTFCTGGIRCEKAAPYLIQNGFKNVYQLKGGILKYFEDCKDSHYQGNCFVFDWRLAVNSNLEPQNRSEDEPVNAGRHIAGPGSLL